MTEAIGQVRYGPTYASLCWRMARDDSPARPDPRVQEERAEVGPGRELDGVVAKVADECGEVQQRDLSVHVRVECDPRLIPPGVLRTIEDSR